MAKFFTKKVCLISLAVVIAVGGVIWAVVANIRPKFHSGITEVPPVTRVSGNGSAAVLVDNYLYFVGDSVETSSSVKPSAYDYYPNYQIPDAGIYRVKLDNASQPILKDVTYNNTYTNDAGEEAEYQADDVEHYNNYKNVTKINDWNKIGEEGNGIEAVVPQIAGHGKTALWVFGDYLIYTTPHNGVSDRNESLSDYLDFYRVNLDGSNHTRIYQSISTSLTTDNFTVWADSTDNIYLLIYETDENSVTSIQKVNVKTAEKTTLATKVSNVVLPKATQYKNDNVNFNENLAHVYGGAMGYVYYTKSREAANDYQTTSYGNLMYACPVNGNANDAILLAQQGDENDGTKFTPLAVTPTVNGGTQFIFSIQKNHINGNGSIELGAIVNDRVPTYHYQAFTVSGDGSGLNKDKTVAIYANNFCTIDKHLYHFTVDTATSMTNPRVILDGASGAQQLISNTVDKVLAVMGDTIYVQSGNNVYVVNADGNSVTEIPTTTTTSDDSTDGDSDSSTSDSTTNTLPLSVLYQPQSNAGTPMILVHDADYIRLYYADQTYKTIRIKAQ